MFKARESQTLVLFVCAFMILPYGETILLVLLAGSHRVRVTVG